MMMEGFGGHGDDGRSPATQGRAATPSAPSPQEVSGKAGIPNAWRAGEFVIAAPDGFLRVAGWIGRNFGLDRRGRAWALTHLPTGRAAGVFDHSFYEVRELVDRLNAKADWTFSDPSDASRLAETFAAVLKMHGLHRLSVKEVPNPQGFLASGIEAPSGVETVQQGSIEDESPACEAGDAP